MRRDKDRLERELSEMRQRWGAIKANMALRSNFANLDSLVREIFQAIPAPYEEKAAQKVKALLLSYSGGQHDKRRKKSKYASKVARMISLCKKGMSTYDIADELDVEPSVIRVLLIKAGVKLRSTSEAVTLAHQKRKGA